MSDEYKTTVGITQDSILRNDLQSKDAEIARLRKAVREMAEILQRSESRFEHLQYGFVNFETADYQGRERKNWIENMRVPLSYGLSQCKEILETHSSTIQGAQK